MSIDKIIVSDKITRVEVIERGVKRHYVNYAADEVVLSLQDEGRTLKVFIKEVKDEFANSSTPTL